MTLLDLFSSQRGVSDMGRIRRQNGVCAVLLSHAGSPTGGLESLLSAQESRVDLLLLLGRMGMVPECGLFQRLTLEAERHQARVDALWPDQPPGAGPVETGVQGIPPGWTPPGQEVEPDEYEQIIYATPTSGIPT